MSELDERHKKRAALKKKRRRRQRRMRLALAALLLVLAACGFGLYYMIQNAPQEDLPVTLWEDILNPTVEETTEETTAPFDPITTIHIRAAGDLNITDSVVDSGLSANGYDYTRAFQDVAPVLGGADVTVVNLEGNICGEPYGSTTTSAPNRLLTSLRDAGVDLIQVANSCAINNGLIGLNATLNAIRSAGLEPVGAYGSSGEAKAAKGYTICEVKGVRVAFVAFTKGLGGMGLPEGSEDCVNLLYTDYDSTYKKLDTARITRILNNVKAEKPDLVVALMHWGSENNDTVSSTQASLVTLLKKNGVNLIIGTHPHLVQKVEFDAASGSLVAYSLGDFFGDGSRKGTNYSIVLDVEITKDSTTGITKVTGWSYTPIYTVLKNQTVDGLQRVVRLETAMSAYNGNWLDKYSNACYDDMTYSLSRIRSRTSGQG